MMADNIISMERPMFLPVREAVKITGLSEYYFRKNMKEGKIPFIKTGNRVFINIPRLLKDLDEQTSNRPIKL